VILQFGTALPDLRRLLHMDLEAASWLFSVRYIGFLVGCLLFGWLYDRYDRMLMMCVCAAGTGLTTLLTPYFIHYAHAVALRVVGGVFAGGVDAGR